MIRINVWRHPANFVLIWLMFLMLSAGPSFGQTAEGSRQKVKVGERAPDFSVPSLDGRTTVRLSDFRGRRVLIFTWASW